MIDIKWIRTNPDLVKANIKKREMNLDSLVDEILAIDVQRRELTGKVEGMKAEQNACTKKIPAMKKAGEDTTALMAEMKALSEKVKEAGAQLAQLEEKQQDLMLSLPNMPDEDVAAGGYELILPPHLLNYECGYVAGQFPKFSEEVYWIQNPTSADRKFMLPTAETVLVNLHRDEILSLDELPRKYIAYTPCYRREAGSYRAEERGMIRGHQFNKVEMVQYTTEEGSDAAFEELVNKAERLVQELGLHYRLSKLAAGDCSFSMARTYDIEVWIPSMGIYKEVSSASNARSYQARRGNIKYRDADKKLHFAHTLNASGLATSRVMPAIVEQFQNADGSVTVPEVLRKYMGGQEIIKP